MKSTEKMAILPKLTIQRRSFFSTGCSLLKHRKHICLKQLFFLFTFLLSFNLFSQMLGLERFKRSEGNMKYILFDKLEDAIGVYKSIIVDNGFYIGDVEAELNSDEEVVLAYTMLNENDVCMFFIANRPTGGFILEVHTMPNDKYIAVRDSQKDDGTFWTYYFDPEKEEEEEE